MIIVKNLKNYTEFYNKLFLKYLGDDIILNSGNLQYRDKRITYLNNNKKYLLCKLIINDNNTLNLKLNYRDKSYYDKGNYINKGYRIAYRRLVDFIYNSDIINDFNINYNPRDIETELILSKEKFVCPITLLDYEEGYKTKCNHIFEKDSIVRWIEENRNCPMCRTEII